MNLILRIFLALSAACLSASAYATPQKRPTSEYKKDEQRSSTMNIRISPILLLASGIAAELDYKINDQVTVGPEFAYINLTVDDVSIKGTGVGAQGRYFFDQFGEDSWYTTAKIRYSTTEASITSLGVKYTGSASGVGFGIGGGYHWFWESFNMNLGAGFTASSVSSIETKDSNGNKYKDSARTSSSLFIEYTLGWMF